MTDQSETLDHEVLMMRRSGRAFARISRDLELKRPADAQRAFQRAVLRLPEGEQEVVRLQPRSPGPAGDCGSGDLSRGSDASAGGHRAPSRSADPQPLYLTICV
jgi:hypothetical protein